MKKFLCLICVLLALLQCAADSQLLPEEVVVSMSIDSTSLEIQREALRLLTSLHFFGGGLRQSTIFICINHVVENESSPEEIEMSTRVLQEQIYLLDFERLIISFSKSLPYPTYSPSLNKMCAFTPHINPLNDEESNFFESVKYMLYLDADVFIASDPLPILAQHLPLARGGDTTLLW